MARAHLVEVFSSVQGEGPEVGRSTLFVRFSGCDLRCAWCDSPHTWKPTGDCRVETAAGSGSFRTIQNPVPVEDVARLALELGAESHRAVSLTGGEPLLQPGPVRALASSLRASGCRVHLETHGLAVSALETVVEEIDLVSMDWKLPSDVHRARECTGDPPFAELHRRFLAVASGRDVVVKLVITPHSTDDEVDRAIASVAEIAPEACLVLQPVTPCGSVTERPRPERMLALGRRAEARLRDVRVMPQTHPIFGVL